MHTPARQLVGEGLQDPAFLTSSQKLVLPVCRAQSTALRLTTETEGWRRTPVPSPPGISAVTSPSPTTPAPRGKQVCHRGRREAEGLTYFLLASWSASDSSNLRASSRNFFILSFISLFLANSCLILSSKPERKPFLFPEE